MAESAPRGDSLTVKTMAIIDYLSAERQALPLQDIADGVGLPRATAFRILSSLRETGYVGQLENKNYYLTYKLLTTSGRLLTRDRFMEELLPYLNYFALTTPCGISLTAFWEDACINLMSISKNVKFRDQLVLPGTAHPCHCTAAGRLFLAQLSPDELDAWFERNKLLPYTSRTIIDPEKLRNEIRRTRERGYGVTDGEYSETLSVLAVPVPAGRGRPMTAVNFSIERSEFHTICNNEFVRSVKDMLQEKRKT